MSARLCPAAVAVLAGLILAQCRHHRCLVVLERRMTVVEQHPGEVSVAPNFRHTPRSRCRLLLLPLRLRLSLFASSQLTPVASLSAFPE
jgi:hypothetical protein